MYDPKQEPHEFVAENREAALEKARAFFGLPADQLLVHEPAAGEVYGLSGRAVVVAVPRDRKPPQRSERDSGGRGREGREVRGVETAIATAAGGSRRPRPRPRRA